MVIPPSPSSIIILNKSRGANPMMIPCTRPPAGAAWLLFSIIRGRVGGWPVAVAAAITAAVALAGAGSVVAAAALGVVVVVAVAVAGGGNSRPRVECPPRYTRF